MKLPNRAYKIIVALHAKHPILAKGTDAQRRSLSRMMAEQTRFELGPTWGHKSASPTRPPSKDAIAAREGGRLWVWDWQNGTSRAVQVRAGSEGEDVTGQHFIDVSPGHDHLGVRVRPAPGPTPPPPPVPMPPSPEFVDDLIEDLAIINREIVQLRTMMNSQSATLAAHSGQIDDTRTRLNVLIDHLRQPISTSRDAWHAHKIQVLGPDE